MCTGMHQAGGPAGQLTPLQARSQVTQRLWTRNSSCGPSCTHAAHLWWARQVAQPRMAHHRCRDVAAVGVCEGGRGGLRCATRREREAALQLEHAPPPQDANSSSLAACNASPRHRCLQTGLRAPSSRGSERHRLAWAAAARGGDGAGGGALQGRECSGRACRHLPRAHHSQEAPPPLERAGKGPAPRASGPWPGGVLLCTRSLGVEATAVFQHVEASSLQGLRQRSNQRGRVRRRQPRLRPHAACSCCRQMSIGARGPLSFSWCAASHA